MSRLNEIFRDVRQEAHYKKAEIQDTVRRSWDQARSEVGDQRKQVLAVLTVLLATVVLGWIGDQKPAGKVNFNVGKSPHVVDPLVAGQLAEQFGITSPNVRQNEVPTSTAFPATATVVPTRTPSPRR